MPELAHAPYSYREDPNVPVFDDGRALFVFDGVCVVCSGGAAFTMRHDRHARINFTPVRSALGQALYRHYAVEWNETHLLVEGGRAYTASAGYLRLCTVLGGAWRCLRVAAIVRERWRDAAYALVARNRYS
jgi:predicted DCC family thiol-disulfide oxidoreductase YuxK